MKSTTDYEIFKHLSYSRTLKEETIKKLMISMEVFGFIVPALTTEDNYIIDGQNRIEAAKRKEIEVLYLDVPILSDNDTLPRLVSVINSTSKLWTLEDYLHMFTDLNRIDKGHTKYYDYVVFKNFIEKEKLSISQGLMLFGNYNIKMPYHKNISPNPAYSRRFKNGDMQLDEKRFAHGNILMRQINEIRYFNERFRAFTETPKFTSALSQLIIRPEYKHKQMISHLTTLHSRIMKGYSTQDYKLMLLDVYNHGQKKYLLSA